MYTLCIISINIYFTYFKYKYIVLYKKSLGLLAKVENNTKIKRKLYY